MEPTGESPRNLLKAFDKACREAGLRLTHQRLEIFRELSLATDHPSAEMLHQRLRRKIPTLSLDTVYRTMATLAGHGLINRVETAESQARFEAATKRHHHLICSRCKEIMDFHWQEIEEAPLPGSLREWGRIDTRNVVVYGICSKCLHSQQK